MIYIFGDSFSQRFMDFTEPCDIRDYVKWKGYEPKMYYDYISEDLNQPIENHSLGGMCNEYILMKFMKCYHKIQPSDVVIFGWTDITRFLIPNFKVNHSHENSWFSSIFNFQSNISQSAKNEIEVMRSHPLYVNKQLDIISFIDTILPHNTTIHWTWCNMKFKGKGLSITNETNGQIPDAHYGEEGHRDLYNRITNELKLTNKVKLNLWDYSILL